MPVLVLENVPEDLLLRIEELAAAERVLVAEKTVQLLRQAIAQKQPLWMASGPPDVLGILEEMRRNAIVPAPGTPDSLELLREDRGR